MRARREGRSIRGATQRSQDGRSHMWSPTSGLSSLASTSAPFSHIVPGGTQFGYSEVRWQYVLVTGQSFINICAARIFSRCGFFVRLLALRLFCRRRDFTVGPLVSDTRLQRRCDTRRNLASKVTSFDPAGTFTRDYISNRTVQHGGTDFKSLTLALPAVILCTTSK